MCSLRRGFLYCYDLLMCIRGCHLWTIRCVSVWGKLLDYDGHSSDQDTVHMPYDKASQNRSSLPLAILLHKTILYNASIVNKPMLCIMYMSCEVTVFSV